MADRNIVDAIGVELPDVLTPCERPRHQDDSPEAVERRTADDRASHAASPEAGERFCIVDMADLETGADVETAWWWSDYIPADHVTVLGGHGGAGKSTLALHVAACMAVGANAFGRSTTRARVAYFSAEDPASLVLKRLRRICQRLGLSLAEVSKQMQIVDASDFDPVLFTERRVDGTRRGTETSTSRALAAYVEREGFDVVVIDNASDVFDADEINRSMVRAFIRSLVGIVRSRNGALLLLAHVDKLTSRAGSQARSESYSGSTAWHNSVRSRLFLLEHAPGELELQHQKSNLGQRLPPLRLKWPVGDVMQLLTGGVVAAIEARTDAQSILRLIHEFTTRGEYITTAITSRTNAARLLSGEKGFPGNLKAADVFSLLRDAERVGHIRREQYRGTDRKTRERWALTAAGLASIGTAVIALTAETADTTPDQSHAPAQPGVELRAATAATR